MSAKDYAAYWDASTERNWRLRSGYGALITMLAAGLSIDHGFAVNQIDWDGERVRLTSPRGTVIARRAIITVSTDVLAGGIIRFLPDVTLAMIRSLPLQLPLGHVEKMFFALEEAEEFPDDAHLMGNSHSSDTGSYMLRPMGVPVVEGFFGGDWVRDAAADEFELLARKELSALLGTDFNRRIRRIAQSDWGKDSKFRGSYSYARPGQHGSREQLAEPIEGRLAFGGEACSQTDFSTVHGAWESGVTAVERLFGSSK